jgi:hypothetical protein
MPFPFFNFYLATVDGCHDGERSHRSTLRDKIKPFTYYALLPIYLFRPNYRRHILLEGIPDVLLFPDWNGTR